MDLAWEEVEDRGALISYTSSMREIDVACLFRRHSLEASSHFAHLVGYTDRYLQLECLAVQQVSKQTNEEQLPELISRPESKQRELLCPLPRCTLL